MNGLQEAQWNSKARFTSFAILLQEFRAFSLKATLKVLNKNIFLIGWGRIIFLNIPNSYMAQVWVHHFPKIEGGITIAVFHQISKTHKPRQVDIHCVDIVGVTYQIYCILTLFLWDLPLNYFCMLIPSHFGSHINPSIISNGWKSWRKSSHMTHCWTTYLIPSPSKLTMAASRLVLGNFIDLHNPNYVKTLLMGCLFPYVMSLKHSLVK